MSQRKKIEQVLEFLINEETERAEELLHDIVVEKARNIYESIVNEEDEDEDEDDDSFGGDVKGEFISDIEADGDDIDSDEELDGEVEVEFGDDDEEGDDEFEDDLDVEDKVEDLEAQLAELRAEFDQLMADELEEPEHDAEEFGYDDESEGDFEVDGEFEVDSFKESKYVRGLEEATKLQDAVPDQGMGTEGKLAGTGKNSPKGAVGKESPYTKAPSKSVDNGGKPVDFTKGSGKDGKGSAESAKDHTPSDNIGENPKNVSNGDQKTDGAFVGTGKASKKGATGKVSPFTKRPKH